MAHSKSKFEIEWLKRKDDNGHLLKWWCSAHETDRFRAKCNLCEKEFQVANSGVSACIQLAAHKIEPEKEKDEHHLHCNPWKIHSKAVNRGELRTFLPNQQ